MVSVAGMGHVCTWVLGDGFADDVSTVDDGCLVVLELIVTGSQAVHDVRL